MSKILVLLLLIFSSIMSKVLFGIYTFLILLLFDASFGEILIFFLNGFYVNHIESLIKYFICKLKL